MLEIQLEEASDASVVAWWRWFLNTLEPDYLMKTKLDQDKLYIFGISSMRSFWWCYLFSDLCRGVKP